MCNKSTLKSAFKLFTYWKIAGKNMSRLFVLTIFSIFWMNILMIGAENREEEKLLKVGMTQKGYIQFIKYKVDVPPLSQFTFCLWLKSHNLSHAHPILSYSRHERDRYIRSRISDGGLHLRTSLMEQEVIDVPLGLRVYHWYHVCQSWDSNTGRWQVYINGNLKGQGTSKNLRDLVIPGGGDVVIGQEYTDFDKGLDDGIEGEIFGFNMILSSTTEEPNHRYYHKEKAEDTRISATESNPDIQRNYVRLIDLNNPREKKQNASEPLKIKHVQPEEAIPDVISEATFSSDDDDDALRPPNQDIPFWNVINQAGREGRFKSGDTQTLALTHLPIYETPPALPILDDSQKNTPTYEVLYSQANFKGNKWYDQNDYFPKELLRRPKQRQNKPKHRYGVPKDSHPHHSENQYFFQTGDHSIFRRDLREKNVAILNPDSVIVYPLANKLLNVEVYPRAGDLDTTETESPSYEVEYSRLHYTGSKDTPNKVLYINPDLYNHPVHTHPAIGIVRKDERKRYPDSITDKINEANSDQFEKNVKLGNVLNEVQIFRQHGNDRTRSFVGGLDIIPDVNRYRSDIDKEIYRFDDVNVNNHQVFGKVYENSLKRFRVEAPRSAGRKLVDLGYRKCLLDGGSALAKDAASLISWTLTPMRIFGGAVLREAASTCGGF